MKNSTIQTTTSTIFHNTPFKASTELFQLESESFAKKTTAQSFANVIPRDSNLCTQYVVMWWMLKVLYFIKPTWLESYLLLALITISATFAYCWVADSDDEEETEEANRGRMALSQVLVAMPGSSLLSTRPRKAASSGDCIVSLRIYLGLLVRHRLNPKAHLIFWKISTGTFDTILFSCTSPHGTITFRLKVSHNNQRW